MAVGIKFFCVRSRETVIATSEPMIAAYFNSSDLNPNGVVQDYGWRLDPKIVKRIYEIEDDEEKLEAIAKKLEVPVENIATYHILKYICDIDAREERKAERTDKNKFQSEYDAELAAVLAEDDADDEGEETVAEPTPVTPKPRTSRPAKKTATPAELAAQKKKDDDVLAEMIAADDNKEG